MIRSQLNAFIQIPVIVFFIVFQTFCSTNFKEKPSKDTILKELQHGSRLPSKVESWESNRRFYYMVNLLQAHDFLRCDEYQPRKKCNILSHPLVITEERVEIDSAQLNPAGQKKRYLRKNLILKINLPQGSNNPERFNVSYTTPEQDDLLANVLFQLVTRAQHCKRPFQIRMTQNKQSQSNQTSFHELKKYLMENCAPEK